MNYVIWNSMYGFYQDPTLNRSTIFSTQNFKMAKRYKTFTEVLDARNTLDRDFRNAQVTYTIMLIIE